MKTLVVIPTTEERDLFLKGCTKRGLRSVDSVAGRLPVAGLVDLDMTIACGGLGKAQFALQTQHLIDTGADWDVVFCAGAAGALVDELSIGDVVVATCTVEHDHKKQVYAAAQAKIRRRAGDDLGAERPCLGLAVFQRALRGGDQWRRGYNRH